MLICGVGGVSGENADGLVHKSRCVNVVVTSTGVVSSGSEKIGVYSR